MYDSPMTDRPRADLVATYASAVYRADTEPEPLYLRVGEASPALERWLAERGVRCFGFLSAANPGSVPLSDGENRRRHQRLMERLQDQGFQSVAGESYEAASGGWREASLLVLSIERQAAVALARDFGQAALLVGEVGAVGATVELVFTTAASAPD